MSTKPASKTQPISETQPKLEARAVKPTMEFAVYAPDTVYSDTPVEIILRTTQAEIFAAEAEYKVVVEGPGQSLTYTLEPDKPIRVVFGEHFKSYAKNLKFTVYSKRRAIPSDSWNRLTTNTRQPEYIAHPKGHVDGEARIINPLHPESWPGAAVITGVVVADFFTEDFYACAGADASLAQYDISGNNRLLSCGSAALDVVGVGKILKIGAKTDDIYDIYRVTRTFRRQGKTYVEVAPAARADILAAQKLESGSGTIATITYEYFNP